MSIQSINRRSLLTTVAAVGVGATISTKVAAHSEMPEMITVSGKGRPSVMAKEGAQLDLDRFAIYRIDLKSVELDSIVLSARGKKATLAEFLKASEEIGLKSDEIFAGTIAITGSPYNFPDISRSTANNIFERPVLAASSGTAYWCALLAYGCHHY